MIINAEAQKHPAATEGLFKRRETEICPEGWNEYSSSLLSLLGLGWHQAAPGRLGPPENRGRYPQGIYLHPAGSWGHSGGGQATACWKLVQQSSLSWHRTIRRIRTCTWIHLLTLPGPAGRRSRNCHLCFTNGEIKTQRGDGYAAVG